MLGIEPPGPLKEHPVLLPPEPSLQTQEGLFNWINFGGKTKPKGGWHHFKGGFGTG